MLRELWEGGAKKECLRADLSDGSMNTCQTKEIRIPKSNYL